MKTRTRMVSFVRSIFPVLVCAGIEILGAATVMEWDAARDLRNNELSGPANQARNPNPSVPAWSYGHRPEVDFASTSLTLLPEHVVDGGGSPDLPGWYRRETDGPAVLANISTNPVVLRFCCGALAPIEPGELAVWPGFDGSALVVRWTAPLGAKYAVSAYWRKTDFNADGGRVSGVVVDGQVLHQQVWFNSDLPGYTNTLTLAAGSVVDFLMGPNGDYSFDGSKFNATIQLLSAGNLPNLGVASATPGGAPIRSSNPWIFTATYAAEVAGVALRAQSTLTPDNEGSWTDLPSDPFLTRNGSDWTLSTTDVPVGNRFFRVIASASAYTDAVSPLLGPFTVLEGIKPFGDFSWQTGSPAQSGMPWVFTIAQPSPVTGLGLRVQSSSAPANEGSWTDLPAGGQMARSESLWTLATTNVPGGTQSFRVIASAPAYPDRISGLVGPFAIRAALPVVKKSYSAGGKYSLLDVPEAQAPDMVYLTAIGQAVVQFGLPFNFDAVHLDAALLLAAQQFARAEMQILPHQALTALAVNAGPNAFVELKGVISGALSLISQDGAGLVAQGAGNLAHDLGTAALISQDGSGLVAQGAGNFIGPATARLGPATLPAPALVQPAFTGLMTVDGDYLQLAGKLYIGIAGTNAASQGAQQFDQLLVHGTAHLMGGSLVVGLFNPDDQTNRAALLQPLNGAIFDVVVADHIEVSQSFTVRGSAVWGDGLFFKWSIVQRPDGLQALRLEAAPVPPKLALSQSGGSLRLSYPANYAGFAIESTSTLSPVAWTTFASNTNTVTLNSTNSSAFFRLVKPGAIVPK